ncbi:MAG: SufD family Fe-S cluster assembly protein, partial [Cyclobacteriaceae bacterium]|nr:SufD family Fe-S cluster assembly protein [Cyclobacteriaceae bacterium]
LIRNNLDVRLNGENCETHMHGLYLINGKCHVDNHTSADHMKPNSYSNELYKGIVDENARAVFNGKIFVRPQAQQTNAFQSNKNISLSDQAMVHTKPQLEIWADDVKCSHGCTIGQLDQEAIFYLRARGLDKQSAKALMLVAFAEESFAYVPFDFLKEELHAIILNRLGQ